MGYPLAIVVGVGFLVVAWVAFGWLHDYTMGYPPWSKKDKKK